MVRDGGCAGGRATWTAERRVALVLSSVRGESVSMEGCPSMGSRVPGARAEGPLPASAAADAATADARGAGAVRRGAMSAGRWISPTLTAGPTAGRISRPSSTATTASSSGTSLPTGAAPRRPGGRSRPRASSALARCTSKVPRPSCPRPRGWPPFFHDPLLTAAQSSARAARLPPAVRSGLPNCHDQTRRALTRRALIGDGASVRSRDTARGRPRTGRRHLGGHSSAATGARSRAPRGRRSAPAAVRPARAHSRGVERDGCRSRAPCRTACSRTCSTRPRASDLPGSVEGVAQPRLRRPPVKPSPPSTLRPDSNAVPLATPRGEPLQRTAPASAFSGARDGRRRRSASGPM
jgi:hypothetical protein